jgi:hypothetical protein
MAKKTIDEALALFASGKSPRECEKLTGIPKTTIDREAKKRGIAKGSLGQLIIDKVRVEAEIGTLSVPELAVVTSEVNKQLEGMEFYQTHARKAVKMGLVALSKDPTPVGMKTVLDGMKSGMQVEGLVPFYPNATSINNTNAKNNNDDKDFIINIIDAKP